MKQNSFSATHYKGKPAVFDRVARVFYTGYKSMRAAHQHADDLNNGK